MLTGFWLLFLTGIGSSANGATMELPPFDGLIEPKELVEYSSHVPGILEKVEVERGSWVKRGQVLARLKGGVLEAQVKLAKARVEYGKRKSVRNKELYKKQLISVHDKDGLETEIQLAELELSVTRERLNLLTIKSTIDGVVVEQLGSPGEYVGEEPFLIVAQINPLLVELVIPMDYFGAVKEGRTAEVILVEPIGGIYQAKVVIVDQVIDAASGTFGVRLELPNPDLKLPAGIKCKVVF